MNPRYHINVFWSDEDSCWIADIPDLRYCSAHGETPEEAMTELQVAAELWLEVAREHDLPIPEPRYRPPMGREFTPSPPRSRHRA
jgi:predicted RNase H-like HicB family nuclease